MDDTYIGRRVREVRSWRGMKLKPTAELAGMSASYLSMIENGKRPVTQRHILEALARALRVAPTELTGRPWDRDHNHNAETHPDLIALAAALDAYEIGDDPGDPARDWPAVATDVDRLVELMQIRADYATQATLLPGLLGELHALYVREPALRAEVLLGLLRCYSSATWVAKLLRSDGLTLMAAMRAQQCADDLASPAWQGYTTWLRGVTTGSLNRNRQYRRAISMADTLTPHLDHLDVAQAYGQLHLSAALAAAAQADRDTAMTHLAEAEAIADRADLDVGQFAQVWFGRFNVRIWRATIGMELGDGPKVAEAARGVPVESIPSPARQAVFYSTVGRGLIAEKRSVETGLRLLLRAEHLAPQHVRGDVFVREAVAGMLRRSEREAGGRELRGLAWRMGVAPTG